MSKYSGAEAMIEKIAQLTDIPVSILKGKSKQEDGMIARHICYYILGNYTTLSDVEIGDLLNKTSASVGHGISLMRSIDNGGTIHQPYNVMLQHVKLAFKHLPKLRYTHAELAVDFVKYCQDKGIYNPTELNYTHFLAWKKPTKVY